MEQQTDLTKLRKFVEGRIENDDVYWEGPDAFRDVLRAIDRLTAGEAVGSPGAPADLKDAYEKLRRQALSPRTPKAQRDALNIVLNCVAEVSPDVSEWASRVPAL